MVSVKKETLQGHENVLQEVTADQEQGRGGCDEPGGPGWDRVGMRVKPD